MKMKSFVMLAVSGILAASCAYMAPALADDMGNQSSTTQQMDPTGMSGSSNSMGMGGATSSTMGPSTSAMSTDQGTPDTATGDDDY